MSSPPPPPELMPELVGEILLRLPPDDPAHLFRAAFVCKPWLRILCGPAFRRRYRDFHRTPPLLGLLHRLQVGQGYPDQLLAPTTAAPLNPYPDCRRALPRDCRRVLPRDCRHGRALFHVLYGDWHFVVWDPVTGDQKRLPEPAIDWLTYSVAVFCAVAGCDHLDCHGGPFRVVFITIEAGNVLVKACVYSSETGAWSIPVSLDDDCEPYAKHRQDAIAGRLYYTSYVQPRRGAVIGDEVYFTLGWGNAVVKYDWSRNCLSMINLWSPIDNGSHIALMVTEDSSLGFAGIEGSRLYLWSRKVNSEGAAEWVQCMVIELETIIPVANSDEKRYVVGAAEGVGVIFISTEVGLFTIELKSERVRKVDEPGVYFSVLPYMSFYTPDDCRLLSLARID